jgi:rubrerythrin
MKKQLAFLLISACAFILIISSCSSPKPIKTIENLKAAIIGESTASAKYAAFAAKAREEGLDTVAKMFDATSKSESIHAANHLVVLNKLGTEFTFELEKFDVLTTKENLLAAINGESYEFSTMYPGFISTATEEKANEAVISFNYANDTEKKHKDFYQKALDVISASAKEAGLAFNWAVCPKCGNTFAEGSIDTNCSFCMTPIDKFLPF